ncbi:putative ubiquitin-protein ligase ASI1 NDAI_0H02730 [Naumovozyma dairenensis CBS 421]|uniref:RING-type domain-containing protein n=1 Tax=Naumovozyma dairenensis (strain ATCC 10597 / BCRC 20456 / CBS 421 / NBRC 0211 / NRRL Y-12639) TaxID=1071378 RepID=G0WF86_NAUDC|nr:hypothetical protein NDAI_0H02730 [Naumovozyma dairenensis CBS 421]CCD26447.1 hypothetical protein NDAI_0H02730 [Naumovozyma dairenensis CBS 421]
MNSTSLLENAPYLNQSSHILIPETYHSLSFINYLYQIIYSFIAAVKQQYQNDRNMVREHLGLTRLLNILEFFFNGYALSCLFIALLLNKFITLVNQRSPQTTNTLRPQQPKKMISQTVASIFHISALIPLIYSLIQPFIRNTSYSMLNNQYFLSISYTIFSYSFIIETVVSTLSQLTPLDGSDFTIFEIAIQFFMMSNYQYDNDYQNKLYLLDWLVAISNRILIHIVELFKIRKSRLIISTILNVTHLLTISWFIITKGWYENLPRSTRYRHLPKLFSLGIIFTSFMVYLLACLVRFNGNVKKFNESLKNLEYYSFYQNWTSNLNCSGEEDFTTVVTKLAMLLTSEMASNNLRIRMRFNSINVPQDINPSLLPPSENISLEKQRNERLNEDRSSGSSYSIKKIWHTSHTYLLKRFIRNQSEVIEPCNISSQEQQLGNIEEQQEEIPDELGIIKTEFTGEDEEDREYIYEETISELESVSSNSNTEILIDQEELLDLLLPEEYHDENDHSCDHNAAYNNNVTLGDGSDWFTSFFPILKYHQNMTNENEILTRSKYLNDFYEKKNCQNCNNEKTKDKDADMKDEVFDPSCVVCKTNERNVILWPCKCFALCEDCRVSLALRGYKKCVCCRTEIRGFSNLKSINFN